MNDLIKTVLKNKPAEVPAYPPDFELKEVIKREITTNADLRTRIFMRFKISNQTLYNWLENSQSTNLTFLFLVWDYLKKDYPTILDLVKIKQNTIL